MWIYFERATKSCPFNSRIRFDSTNVMEYLLIVSGQYVAAVFEFMHFGNLTAFGIGVFILFLAAIDELNGNLGSIDNYDDSTETHLDVFKELTAFIHRYAIVQELSVLIS